ncbi:hypothetical protein KQI82_09060 [Oscillibacter sp. MSJ-2]|uniref:Membrane protein YkvI n=1 Tax=Dysosmobacter acutus TaxID=2841504 RepID=A0ABS6FCI6_9FIRM|nr:hypothetical protein [Dysosmobacter acutus]MBU5627054.1 hypothetical protein [Dysosmobacter acutus]
MKNLTAAGLAVTYAGCFLGAGYVSGQELWQFFGSFGKMSVPGLLLAVALLAAFGMMLLRLAQMTGIEEMDRLVVRKEWPWLRKALSLFECVFLFGVTAIMSAGAGALTQQLLGIPSWLGGILMTAAVVLIAFRGLRGLVSAFSILVPVLVLVTVLVALAALIRFPMAQAAFAPVSEGSFLMKYWPTAAITFASYNVLGAVGVLAPLGKYADQKKTVWRGVALGCGLLLLIALSVILALRVCPQAISQELPMLALASALSPALAYVYGALLLLAMFGTSLSSLVAVVTLLRQKFPLVERSRGKTTALLGAAAALGSLMGFGDLISVLYPLFGYLSGIFLLFMGSHYLWCRRREKGQVQENCQ